MVTKRPRLPEEGKSKERKGGALSTAQKTNRLTQQRVRHLTVLEGGKGNPEAEDAGAGHAGAGDAGAGHTPKRKRPILPGVTKPERETVEKKSTAPVHKVRGGLTAKQEAFCRGVVRGLSYSDAYREAYDAENMANATINRQATGLVADSKIAARIAKLIEAKERGERHDASRIRAHIEQRLWHESTKAETGAARLKAIELLGKLDHVGAFKDRVESETMDNREPEDIEDALAARLAELGADTA